MELVAQDMTAARGGAAAVAAPEAGIGWFVRRSLGLLRPYWAASALITLAITIHLGYSTFLALSFKFLVDYALTPHDAGVLLAIVGALAGLLLVTAAADVGHDYLLASVSARAMRDLRLAMFAQLQRMPMGFYAHAAGGDLVAYFSGDLAAVEAGVSRALPKLFGAAVRVALSVVILFVLEWRLALVVLVAFPAGLLGPKLFGARAARASGQRKQAEALVLGTLQEQIAAQSVIKAFRLQASSLASFRAVLEQLVLIGRRADFLARLVGRTTDIAQVLVQVVVVSAGAALTFYGIMSVGSLLAFFGMLFSMGSALLGVSEVMPELIQAASGFRRIDGLLARQAPLDDAPDAVALPPIRREILVDDVLFRYTDLHINLDRVTCRIPAGRSVALVGRSGSGKSTLLSLIMRFYDPDSGAVQVDGHDLRGVTQDSLRTQIGVVFQDPMLLNTTVRENIRLGCAGASDAEVEAAARAAEVHETIMRMPLGYDTPVGERGSRLSGGQRQRIALARAIIGDPAVLILDEATSALDPEAEAAINATLRRLAVGRTVISATHRLAAIQDVDQILVFDRGRIVEQGRHADLLDLQGVYFQLWEQQSGFTVSRDGQTAAVTAERLRAIGLFQDLDQTPLEILARQFVTQRLGAGKLVFEEGEPADAFYIIARGSVDVHLRDADGAERWLATLQDGDFFGEVALLEGIPRTATVRTRAPSTLLMLDRERFQELVSATPALRGVLEMIAKVRQEANVVVLGSPVEQAG
ncbi:MAG TPA: ATP-binding cassette domain-containing protein [Roseiflexaceae bacterium]|nr:ATP-binding cassette domain-containing protein [Roseiflexaceae bacterium]